MLKFWNKKVQVWQEKKAGRSLPFSPLNNQVFILPTKHGLIISLMLFVMLIGSLNYNNNLALFFTFMLSAGFLFSAFQCQNYLKSTPLEQVVTHKAHAKEPINLHFIFFTHQRDELSIQIKVDHFEGKQTIQTNSPISVQIPSLKRGYLSLPLIRISTRYPYALFESWTWFRLQHEPLIYPALEKQAPPLPINSGDIDTTSLQTNQGDDPQSLRKYQTGDPLNRVAWKQLARHREWLTRESEQSQQGRILFSMASTGTSDKERSLSRLTSWIIEAERKQLDYSLELPGKKIDLGKGDAHMFRCLEALALA